MFDENTKSIKVSGKSFNPGSTLNTNTEYGKVVFAEQVVRKNLATISFEGFRPLLDRINEAIGAYIGKSISAPTG
jgi:hypothetical protein